MILSGVMLAACAATPEAPQGPLARQRLLPLAPPPQIVAGSEAGLADALTAVRRLEAKRDAAAGAPRVEAVAEPFLYGSPLGRRFLALAPARALAIGDPPERCPAAGIGHEPGDGAAARRAAAGEALRRCLAAGDGRAACGCRLLALDDMLLAGPRAFTYAPGVGGRLVGDGAGGRGAPLTVSERATDDPARTLIGFFDAAGPVAVGEVDDGGAARLVMLESGAVFQGARERRGWRRGRIMERLLLSDAAGRRLIALIGFEPADIVAEGAALAVWPRG